MPEPRGWWRRWRDLPSRERRQLVAIGALLPLIDVALRVGGVRRTRRALLRLSERPRHAPEVAELNAAQRLAALASSLGQHGGHHTSCLRQSLAVEFFLRRRGLPAELRLGTHATSNRQFEAHAWVELAGVALAQDTPPPPRVGGAEERLR